jgi:dihydrofolate reductase
MPRGATRGGDHIFGRQDVSKLRFRISMSLDGFVAGPSQSVDNPLGIGGMRLHQWVFPLTVWRAMHGLQGGEVNESTRVVEESLANIGASVMGRNMFGGHPSPWDAKEPWNGWWGVNPPFHHPVFVLSHYAREPLELEGGTTFTFVTDGIEAARSTRRGEPPATRMSSSPAERVPHSSISRPASWTRWSSTSCRCS